MKKSWKSRFMATFDPAFYELYIYILFKRLGYSLTIHPEIPHTLKRPDYLATRTGRSFFIEVKHMTMLSHNEQSLERRKNTLLDSVDATNFLLKLDEIIFKDNSQPRGNLIIKFFNEIVSSQDPDVYTDQLAKNGYRNMPMIVYDDDKVTVKVQLVPKSPMHRGTQARAKH